MEHVLSYQDAAAVVRREAAAATHLSRETERVPLSEARSRVLAQDVVADRDQPPFARATRDGYACRAADLKSPLTVVGTVRAGELWQGAPLAAGLAIEIMTGAPVPDGADCVLMVEHAVLERQKESQRLVPGRLLSPGENIVPAGAEARAGATLVPAGTRLRPSQIGAAASCGHADVAVYRRPRIGILATGDELVDISAQPALHQIRNSNSYSLAAQAMGAGAEPLILPTGRDDEQALTGAVGAALAQCDLLLLSGGVSMGKYDFVELALSSLGAEYFFTGAKIQPGRPVVFGRALGRYFFGLPGNPVSTLVTFALFAAPLVRALGGERDAQPLFASAQAAERVEVKPGLTRFLPAVLEAGRVRVVPWQGSGDLAATARTNAYLVLDERCAGVERDEFVPVLLG